MKKMIIIILFVAELSSWAKATNTTVQSMAILSAARKALPLQCGASKIYIQFMHK